MQLRKGHGKVPRVQIKSAIQDFSAVVRSPFRQGKRDEAEAVAVSSTPKIAQGFAEQKRKFPMEAIQRIAGIEALFDWGELRGGTRPLAGSPD